MGTVSARGCLGRMELAHFQRSPLGHVPLQPWLSTPAIPTTLALVFLLVLLHADISMHPDQP